MKRDAIVARSIISVGIILVSSWLPAAAGGSWGEPRTHVIELRERVLCPDDGLLLGNGDLSVSVYQTADRIIWRFGKSDVWDRRLDLGDDPKPAHIDEVAHGIKVEGWKCGPYGGPVEATRGTEDPKRMRELCQGAPPSYVRRPYPCPKPVGELAMQLPPDQMGLRIHQRLVIEQAVLSITCSWPSGIAIDIECFVAPSPNVLVVHWRARSWNDQTRTGNNLPPVWFSLYRWADPTIQAFAARFFGDYRHGAFRAACDSKATPLPPPSVRKDQDAWLVEQRFPPDPLFADGFCYSMAPFAPETSIGPVDMGPTGEARLHLIAKPDATEGWLAVAVPSSSDKGGAAAELQRVRARLADKPIDVMRAWADDTRRKAAEFWSRSAVRIADPFLEKLWYETLHARRCTYRDDTVPPGLFLPSTVQDYSHWHGDYHTNYNYQEPFWADYTANHLELGDAYFIGMKFLLQIGRKIARDYYNCRGIFVQLSGYPIHAQDDPLGVVPMGRMAYMTGWAMNQYWWRYLYTKDKAWLRSTGYPVIRDCALFYTDFLKKGQDGLYHAFPSNQGEDGFSGNPKDYTDRGQVMHHARYCLRAAVLASETLAVDEALRSEWGDRLEHLAPPDGRPGPKRQGIAKWCAACNPPEFGLGRPYRPQPEAPSGPSAFADRKNGLWTWYFGQFPWQLVRSLRQGDFVADRDLPNVRQLIERWRHPNGLVWGMAIANYGHAGAWTESLGVIAPLQEMMLQSWDGALRIFPAWPSDLDAQFKTFRAEGAFLVSASWSKGGVVSARVFSEKGGPCRVYSPWTDGLKVLSDKGEEIKAMADRYGRPSFETSPGRTYRLVRLGQQTSGACQSVPIENSEECAS